MTHIVKGHGERVDDQKTFVATGRKLRFYSGFDVDLNSTVALAAIATGASAPAVETVDGTGTVGDVANYELFAQDDGFYAKWLAMGGESGLPISWVGNDIPDGTRLCDNPDTCNGLGEHTCTGVLGRVDDTDIVLLACRGVEGSDATETKYGTDADDPLHELRDDVGKFVDDLLELAKNDVAKAEQQVDGLPQGSLALMQNRGDFCDWQSARHLSQLAAQSDVTGVFGLLTANADDAGDIVEWLDDVPSYGKALDSFAENHTEDFFRAFDAASDEVKDALRKRQAVHDLETSAAIQNLFGGDA